MPLGIEVKKPDGSLWKKEGEYGLVMWLPGYTKPMLLKYPQQYEDNEEAGVMYSMTSGVPFVERTGLQDKIINISGTSGQYPDKTTLPILGTIIPSSLTSILGQFKGTGYYIFHEMRQYIHKYWKLVGQGDTDVRMFYYNTKDKEYYEVEPMTLRRSRVTGKPGQYNWQLTMRVTGDSFYEGPVSQSSWLDKIKDGFDQAKMWQNAAFDFMMLAGAIAEDVYDLTYAVATLPLEIIQGITRVSSRFAYVADRFQKLSGRVKSSYDMATDSLRSVLKMGDGKIIDAAISETGLPTFENIRDNLLSEVTGVPVVLNAAEQNLGLFESTMQGGGEDENVLNFYGNALELMMNAYTLAANAPIIDEDQSFADRYRGWMKNFSDAARSGEAGKFLAVKDDLASATLEVVDGREPTVNHGAARLFDSFGNNMVDRNIGPSSLAELLGLNPIMGYPDMLRVVKVTSADTIYSIASRELGSWKRWIEIAVINNLNYPYITRTPGECVVAYGEWIKIPAVDAPMDPAIYAKLARLGELLGVPIEDVYMGVDILVGDVSEDMKLEADGDYALTTGLDYFVQSIHHRFSAIYGTLVLTPNLGTKMEVGDKQSFTTAILSGLLMTRELERDVNVAEVVDLNIAIDKSTVSYNIKLKLDGLNDIQKITGYFRG